MRKIIYVCVQILMIYNRQIEKRRKSIRNAIFRAPEHSNTKSDRNLARTQHKKPSNETIGGILGTAPQNTIISNCFVTGSVTSAEYAVGGIVGRALGNQAWNTFDPNVDVNTTISDCIVFSPSIKTTKSGGVDNNKWFSGGAIVGFASPKNTMRNCWRKADMAFNFFTLASLNVLSDDADTSPEKPLPYPSGSPKYYRPYNGKAAENNATVSSVAKVIGWSEAVWDLSASVPSLRCFPSVR